MKYFVFSGPIGSGKSTISKKFASDIGAGWSGFGSTVKEIAEERGLSTTREELQKLGAILVDKESKAFCERVFKKAADNSNSLAVIDGLRHAHMLRELRELSAPRTIFFVFVDASNTVRAKRVFERDGIDAQALAKLDGHSTEVQVQTELKELADFVAGNNRTPEECVAQIVSWAKL